MFPFSGHSVRRQVSRRSRRLQVERLEDRRAPAGVIFTENFSFDDPNNPPTFMSDLPGFDTGLDGFHIRGAIGGDSGLAFLADLVEGGMPMPDANQASAPWALALLYGENEQLVVEHGRYVATIPGVGEPDGLLPGEEIALAKVSVWGNGRVTFVGSTGRTSTIDVFAFQGWQFVSRASAFEDEQGNKLGGIVEIRVETVFPNSLVVVDDVTVLIGTEQGTGEVVAFDDGATVAPGGSVVIDVLFNDVAPRPETMFVSQINGGNQPITRTEHGTVIRNPLGRELIYTPDPGFHGIDSFEYTMSFNAPSLHFDTGRVIITVNHVPNAEDFTISLTHDEVLSGVTITGNLLSLGSDADGDPLTAILVNDLLHGAIDLRPDGSFTFQSAYVYDPSTQFVGDHFQFKFNDGFSDSRLITVRVGARNHEPVASPEFYFMELGSVTLSIDGPGLLANDSDPNGDLLTIEVVIPPSKGRLTRSPFGIHGGFTYEPFVGLTGWDVFAYQVADPWTRSELVGVTIALPADQIHDAALAKPDSREIPIGVLYREQTQRVVNNDFGIVYDALEEDPLDRLKPRSLVGRPDLYVELVRDVDSGVLTLEDSGAYSYRSDPGIDPFPFSSDSYLVHFDYQITYPSFFAGQRVTLVTNGIVVTLAVEDTDGIFDEDAAPNLGDGNRDGIPDGQQANVASLPSALAGVYLTLEAPTDTYFKGVKLGAFPPPLGASLPLGDIQFTLMGLEPGGAAAVTLFLEHPVQLSSYYKRGQTPDQPGPPGAIHPSVWYEFLYDGHTGAQFFDAAGQLLAPHSGAFVSRIVLHLADGQRGDNVKYRDGNLISPLDGVIEDPGGPVVIRPPTVASVVIPKQRAPMKRLAVAFDELVTLDRGAFTLLRRGDAKPIRVNVAVSEIGGRTVARLTFQGRGVVKGALPPGRYKLTIRAAKVHGFLVDLDGDKDGAPGGDAITAFFRRAGKAGAKMVWFKPGPRS